MRETIGSAETSVDAELSAVCWRWGETAEPHSSSTISSAHSTIFAPSLMRACAPRLRPLRTLPGTAITSRPCSSAQAAVISEPDFSLASITTTARDSPLIRRLRIGKNSGSGGVAGGYSLTTMPSRAICAASGSCSAGYMRSNPDPRTAAVRPVSSAPRCAAESTPRARPLTTVMPRDARSLAIRVAVSMATADAAREPTIATAGAVSASSSPRNQSAGGRSSNVSSAAGNAGSFQATVRIPRLAAAARTAAACGNRARARSRRWGSSARSRSVRPGRGTSEKRANESATASSGDMTPPRWRPRARPRRRL